VVFGSQSSLSFNGVQILWETLTGHFLRPEKSTFQTHWDAGSNLNRICSFLRDYNLETNQTQASAKYSQLSQLYVLLKKLPPEKKMTASCHPALFESEKSCRWMWKGKENRESGKPGFVLEQKSSNWKISGNGCEHMWKSHRKWRYLSNCIKMFLSTATIGRNEESEVAVIWPNWPILTPNILDSKC
jgi:hypothetical protein